jgi:hypothetical protein
MATTKTYGSVISKAFNKEIDFDSDTIKVALLSSSYTPNQDTHDYFNDVSSFEVSGTGYTAGGATLANKSVTYTGATNVTKFDADDVSWTSSTITARYAVVYDSTGTASTSALIGYVDFGSDQSSSSGTFSIVWDSAGIFTTTAD